MPDWVMWTAAVALLISVVGLGVLGLLLVPWRGSRTARHRETVDGQSEQLRLQRTGGHAPIHLADGHHVDARRDPGPGAARSPVLTRYDVPLLGAPVD
ncbi:hypothetical protein [Cryptosporangium sp. NPDC051539]|uniref:hypothetical protein n=1 Tax=Cryptosporangium sp. NPDC051539 TaxID=3363962 RepID=UPI0037BB466F